MFKPDTRFIVIDDFSTMRKILKKTLSEIGYSNVVEADDGASAWKILQEAKAKNEPIQFIISDWNMPQMPGIELLKECRKDSTYAFTPFMLVTAEGEQKQIIEAIKLGCSDYVVKPFAPSVIKEKINKIYSKVAAKSAA